MKRIAVAFTALAVSLVAAGSAFAASVDTYTGAFSFKGSPGTSAKPAPLNFSQKFTIKSKTKGSRTAILSDIKVKVSNAAFDASVIPTCSSSKIAKAGDDTSCPKTAEVASGSIMASIGPKKPFTTATGQACNPILDVWNAGGGALVFFFRTTGAHSCLGGQLKTGSVGPFMGSAKKSGSGLLVDIPIPSSVTHPVSGQAASVTGETLNWKSVSKGSKSSISSTGCKGKRSYGYTFKAATPTGQNETASLTGTAACG